MVVGRDICASKRITEIWDSEIMRRARFWNSATIEASEITSMSRTCIWHQRQMRLERRRKTDISPGERLTAVSLAEDNKSQQVVKSSGIVVFMAGHVCAAWGGRFGKSTLLIIKPPQWLNSVEGTVTVRQQRVSNERNKRETALLSLITNPEKLLQNVESRNWGWEGWALFILFFSF